VIWLTLSLLTVAVVVTVLIAQRSNEQRKREEREQLQRFVAQVQSSGIREMLPERLEALGVDDVQVAGAAHHQFEVVRPDELPTFADLGGMEELKATLRDSIGMVLDHRDTARDYQVAFNGLLLHGPPGTGKSYLARAIAGEFGLSLLHLSTGDLVEGIVGASAANVDRAFAAARAARPSLLFLDEFDSIAQRRESAGHAEERRTVNQLLVSIEQVADEPDVLVVAATNDIDHLDPAVIRPGRFDRHVRVDLPDRAARQAILQVHFGRRPSCADTIDLDSLAARTDGWTAAALANLVEDAAMRAFRDAAGTGEQVLIGNDHVEAALRERGGTDRPTVENWSWDDLVLPADTLAELRQLEALLVEPDLVEQLGIQPPRGVLLAGPPGTGKTSIARVLAAQARCSFYPVSAGDVSSRWHGESERSIQRLFARARENRPSIVFLDEIDALGRARSEHAEVGDRQLTQLLTEMDGLGSTPGVMVLAATNRPDVLDPALTRGGRLGRTITIPLPDHAQRLAMLQRFTQRMPTVGLDLDKVAGATDGLSGADLRTICQQAGLHALVRAREAGQGQAAVEVLPEDMARAILDIRA
jgi:transitional endoplasmic reticulum ATPase